MKAGLFIVHYIITYDKVTMTFIHAQYLEYGNRNEETYTSLSSCWFLWARDFC